MNFRRLTTLLALSALALSLCAPSDAFIFKKKKAAPVQKDTTEKKAPVRKKTTPYTKFMQDVADSASGGFATIYRTKKDKIFLGFPRENLGRRILIAGTVTSTSNPSSVMVGYKYNTPLCLKVDMLDSLALLTLPSIAGTTDSSHVKAFERNYTPEVYKVLPLTFNKDSTELIFEVTSIVNSMLPKAREFDTAKGSGEGKTTWFSDLKSFPDNASLKVNSNVSFFRSVMGFKFNAGSGSISTTVSFLLLPDEKMKPRVQDKRVGVFSTAGTGGRAKVSLDDSGNGLRTYRLANRWRVEPADSAAWLAGDTVDVVKPIVWYIDDSFPQEWKEPIKRGILAWNKAFEAFGLRNVLVVRDFPSEAEDSDFDPDNLRYNCIRYVPNTTMNAQGPSWVDPETGEILNASVMVYNDVARLVGYWRFVQTGQIDERVRAVKLPEDVLDESLVYVISHEVGHTLGLMHNMAASSAYPTEKLRDAAFTAQYGTTPSIMDYARFNYVAQKGDTGVSLTPPSLGVYDYYAIEWLYRPVYGAKDMWEEARLASKLIDSKGDNPLYRYGAQQPSGSSSYEAYDPSARTEDLGDDPIKSSDYGIANLKYILSSLPSWIEEEGWDYRLALYSQIASQYGRYLGNVLAQVGGIRLYYPGAESSHLPAEAVSAAVQKKSLEWTLSQLRSCSWIDNPTLRSHSKLSVPYSNQLASSLAKELVKEVPDRVQLCSTLPGKSAYSLADYYDGLYKGAFASSISGRSLSSQEKTLQRELVSAFAKPLVAQRNKTSLAGIQEVTSSSPELTACQAEPLSYYAESSSYHSSEQSEESVLSLGADENWCGFETSVGENEAPYQRKVDIASIDETLAYNAAFLSRVENLAGKLRSSGPASDRAHYEYLYRTITATR